MIWLTKVESVPMKSLWLNRTLNSKMPFVQRCFVTKATIKIKQTKLHWICIVNWRPNLTTVVKNGKRRKLIPGINNELTLTNVRHSFYILFLFSFFKTNKIDSFHKMNIFHWSIWFVGFFTGIMCFSRFKDHPFDKLLKLFHLIFLNSLWSWLWSHWNLHWNRRLYLPPWLDWSNLWRCN